MQSYIPALRKLRGGIPGCIFRYWGQRGRQSGGCCVGLGLSGCSRIRRTWSSGCPRGVGTWLNDWWGQAGRSYGVSGRVGNLGGLLLHTVPRRD